MKYLKLYEVKKYSLKKYIIWKIKDFHQHPRTGTNFTILEVIDHNDKYQIILLKRLFLYDLEINKEIDLNNDQDDNLYRFTIGHIKDNIQFESDEYDDCLDYLKMILASNKYNL